MRKKHHGRHEHHKHHEGRHSAPGGPDGHGMGTHEYHVPHNPIMSMHGGGLHGPQGSYNEGHGEMGGRPFGVHGSKCSGCMK